MKAILLAVVLALATSCVAGRSGSRARIFDSGATSLALRGMQTRVFDTGDRTRTLRAVIATLQDLGFMIADADEFIGTVSATKMVDRDMRASVTVRSQGEGRTWVRVNAQDGRRKVEDPASFQQFFAALEKEMSLSAKRVD